MLRKKGECATVAGVCIGIFSFFAIMITLHAGRYSIGTNTETVLGDDYANTSRNNVSLPGAMPWHSVGGCGAGGSGGGGGGVKWIGEGVHGGLKDMQLKFMEKFNFGQTFRNHTIETRFSFKPRYSTTIGVTLPIVSKLSSVQPFTHLEEKYHVTGGTGDISIDIAQALGMAGSYTVNLSLTLPTGQYDIKRGNDAVKKILPTGMQKGGGIYNASLALSRNIDTDNGMWMLDCSFSHGFNMKLLSGENEFMEEYYADYTHYKDSDAEEKEHFYYRFKPYGENDLGDYTPPSISASVYYADRSHEQFMQSFGISTSFPLDVAKVHSEDFNGDATKFQPRDDPDHEAWSVTFSYGIEFKNEDFPVFFGVACPLHDRHYKKEKEGFTYGYDLPDMQDFLQQWTVAGGVKVALFK
jgi:hypothetical protein